jgi:hypothetical protein
MQLEAMIQVRLPPSIFCSLMLLLTHVTARNLERNARSQPVILADASSSAGVAAPALT